MSSKAEDVSLCTQPTFPPTAEIPAPVTDNSQPSSIARSHIPDASLITHDDEVIFIEVHPHDIGREVTPPSSAQSSRGFTEIVTPSHPERRYIWVSPDSSDDGYPTDKEDTLPAGTHRSSDALCSSSGGMQPPSTNSSVMTTEPATPTAPTVNTADWADQVPSDQRWYTVIVGRNPGVFQGYHHINPNISGIPGNASSRYRNEEEARQAYQEALDEGLVVRVTIHREVLTG